MKIVFLAPFGIRPKGTVIARMLPLAVELQQFGYTTSIVVPPYTNPEDSGKTEYIKGVKIVNILIAAGWKPVATLIMAWRMYLVAQAEQPDLIHLFKPKGYAGLIAMVLVLLKGLGFAVPPVVVDTDDLEGYGGMNDMHPYSKMERVIFAFQERWLLSHARSITVASIALMQFVRELAGSETRVDYLPNCVDVVPQGDGRCIRERLGIPVDKPVVLLYTRFFEFDQNDLHMLFAEICRHVPTVCFVVVGAGRNGEETQLVDAAARLGFGENLVCVGWVQPAEIADYLAVADVAVYPFSDNLVNRCKCPAKLTELMRAGIAVVADGVGQITEYIKNGESGILCSPGDWNQMAVAVIGLLGDPNRRVSLGLYARQEILLNFTWRSSAEKLHELYTDLLTLQRAH